MSYQSLSQFMNASRNSGTSAEYKDVPDNIINFNGPGEVKQKISYLNEISKSNLLITLNTNVSYKLLLTPDDRAKLARLTNAVMKRLGERFEDKSYLKTFGADRGKPVTANVVSYQFALEMGNKKGFMHAHALLMLDGRAQVNVEKANAWLEKAYKEYHTNGKPYLNVKNFVDSKTALEHYVNKQQ